MASVGIFFGSDTGNTEAVAKMIQKQLGKHLVHVQDIAKSSKEDIDNFDLLLLGIPTWYYGEAQCDWDDFFPELEQIDFSTKLVAIFGCGDQKTTQNTSAMRWVQCVTSLSLKAAQFLVILQLKATSLKLQKHLLKATTANS